MHHFACRKTAKFRRSPDAKMRQQKHEPTEPRNLIRSIETPTDLGV